MQNIGCSAKLKSKRCVGLAMGWFGVKDPETAMKQAMVHMAKNQPKKAVGLFDQVLKHDRSNEDALCQKSLALLQLRKFSDVITCSDALLEKNPRSPQAYNNKGKALGELGDIAAAVQCYDDAIRLDSKYYESYFNKGVLLARLHDHEAALKLMQKAVKLNRKNPVPLLHEGIILGKMHRHKEALSVLKSIERRFGYHPDVTFQIGIQTAELGKHAQALKIFEGISGHSNNVNILYALARSRAALEEYSTAMDLLKKAVAKSPKVIREWAREEDAFKPLYHNERFRKLVKM